jgi:hypothetical protein
VNKSDDPTIIFFKTSFCKDKGSTRAKGVFLEQMIFHLDHQLFQISISLLETLEINNQTSVHAWKRPGWKKKKRGLYVPNKVLRLPPQSVV